jgi:hypothetical protein
VAIGISSPLSYDIWSKSLLVLRLSAAYSISIFYVSHLHSPLKDFLLYISFLSNSIIYISFFMHNYLCWRHMFLLIEDMFLLIEDMFLLIFVYTYFSYNQMFLYIF